MDKVWSYLEQLETELISLRRTIHKNPELGFKEFKTQERIINFLTDLDLEIETMAKTGVVALLDCGGVGPTIAFRADMDALPLQEQTGLEYASQKKGLMHACGHDGHVAILLILTKLLTRFKNDLSGKIKFIFQPAEEGPGGAKPLIDEGALKNPEVDKIFALHISNELETGIVGIQPEVASASSDELDITIRGKAGHVSTPHEGVDAIVVAANVITALQNLLTRQIDPLNTITCNLGLIEGGDRRNIIADEVKLKGTVRTTNPELREGVSEKIKNMLIGITSAYGAGFELDYRRGYPVLANSSQLLEGMKVELDSTDYIKALREIKEPSLGSEDFAYYLQEVPGLFFRLGAKAKVSNYSCHHPKFNFDEAALKVGVALFAKLAFIFLQNKNISGKI